MVLKTFILSSIIFATLHFTEQAIGDTSGFFRELSESQNQNSPKSNANLGQDQNQQQQQPSHQAYLESFPMIPHTDRSFTSSLWNPFHSLQTFSLDSLVQPAVTAIGIIVGLYGFSQITEWLFQIIASANSKVEPSAKPKAEDTNEVDDARKKRTISAEDTYRILDSIETAAKAFGL